MKRTVISFVLLLMVAPAGARTLGLTGKALQNTERKYE